MKGFITVKNKVSSRTTVPVIVNILEISSMEFIDGGSYDDSYVLITMKNKEYFKATQRLDALTQMIAEAQK